MIKKNVAVTGATGFLGRNLVSKLSKEYYEVSLVQHEYFDLTKESDVKNMYECIKPNIVIHLAASVGGIQYNLMNPAKLLYDNCKMGLNIVNQAKVYGKLDKLCCMGSVCMYAIVPPRIPFVEDDIWYSYPEPSNAPYGESKRVLLEACKTYRRQYGLNAIFLIPTNMYGPFDCFEDGKAHVIPMLIKRAIEAKEKNLPFLTVWGSGVATRDFLYAGDCADLIISATKNYSGELPINLGSGMEISIYALAGLIAELVGYKGEIKWDISRPDGQPRRVLDISRSIEWLGYKEEDAMPLREGLERTIKWYLENRK